MQRSATLALFDQGLPAGPPAVQEPLVDVADADCRADRLFPEELYAMR